MDEYVQKELLGIRARIPPMNRATRQRSGAWPEGLNFYMPLPNPMLLFDARCAVGRDRAHSTIPLH